MGGGGGGGFGGRGRGRGGGRDGGKRFTSDLYVFFNIILFPVHTNSVSLVSTWHMTGGRGRGGPPNKARGSISEFKGNKITFD